MLMPPDQSQPASWMRTHKRSGHFAFDQCRGRAAPAARFFSTDVPCCLYTKGVCRVLCRTKRGIKCTASAPSPSSTCTRLADQWECALYSAVHVPICSAMMKGLCLNVMPVIALAFQCQFDSVAMHGIVRLNSMVLQDIAGVAAMYVPAFATAAGLPRQYQRLTGCSSMQDNM